MRIRPQTDSLFLYLLTINQSSPLDFCAWRKATSTMSHPVFQIKLRGINCQPTNPRKNTDNYNGAITLLHERLVFDDEYVDTRIWTTGSAV